MLYNELVLIQLKASTISSFSVSHSDGDLERELIKVG